MEVGQCHGGWGSITTGVSKSASRRASWRCREACRVLSGPVCDLRGTDVSVTSGPNPPAGTSIPRRGSTSPGHVTTRVPDMWTLHTQYKCFAIVLTCAWLQDLFYWLLFTLTGCSWKRLSLRLLCHASLFESQCLEKRMKQRESQLLLRFWLAGGGTKKKQAFGVFFACGANWSSFNPVLRRVSAAMFCI